VRLFKRSRPSTVNHKPTWQERRAAEQTEQKIHEIADQVRSDLKHSR
jgi:hypothetical protein